jgi:hypothetical protein
MPFKMVPHSSWYYQCEVDLLAPGVSLQEKSLLGKNYETLLKVTGNDMARLEKTNLATRHISLQVVIVNVQIVTFHHPSSISVLSTTLQVPSSYLSFILL